MFAVKYLGAQIASFLFDFLVFALLSLAGNGIFISNFLSKIASGILAFTLQRHFVFKASKDPISRQIWLYLGLWVANIFGTSWLIIQIDSILDNRYAAKLVTDGIAFVINYLVSKHLIFTNRARAKMHD
jgi:putative flippase GtrA